MINFPRSLSIIQEIPEVVILLKGGDGSYKELSQSLPFREPHTTRRAQLQFTHFWSPFSLKNPPTLPPKLHVLTPNAEYRLVRLWFWSFIRNTSDLGLGGFLGLSITRVSSQISSSSNFESDDTDNWRLTNSWRWLSCHSENKNAIETSTLNFLISETHDCNN